MTVDRTPKIGARLLPVWNSCIGLLIKLVLWAAFACSHEVRADALLCSNLMSELKTNTPSQATRTLQQFWQNKHTNEEAAFDCLETFLYSFLPEHVSQSTVSTNEWVVTGNRIKELLLDSPDLQLPKQLRLLSCLSSYPLLPKDFDNSFVWREYRRKAAQRWLSAGARLNAALQVPFDPLTPENLYTRHVRPPPETGLPVNASPTNIADLKLRAQYEAALEENARRGRRNNERAELKLFKINLDSELRLALSKLYLSEPNDLSELRDLLNSSALSETQKNAILAPLVAKFGDDLPKEPVPLGRQK